MNEQNIKNVNAALKIISQQLDIILKELRYNSPYSNFLRKTLKIVNATELKASKEHFNTFWLHFDISGDQEDVFEHLVTRSEKWEYLLLEILPSCSNFTPKLLPKIFNEVYFYFQIKKKIFLFLGWK